MWIWSIKGKSKTELRFQELVDNGYGVTDATSGQKKLTIPWGFIVPSYDWGMERCEDLSDSETQRVCKSDENSFFKKDKNLMATYRPPTRDELSKIVRYPFPRNEKNMVSSKAARFSQETYSKMCDLFIFGEIGRRGSHRVFSKQKRLELRQLLFELSLRL